MRLFSDFLTISHHQKAISKRRALDEEKGNDQKDHSKKEENTKIEDPNKKDESANNDDMAAIMTLDGEPPNGGVLPGRLMSAAPTTVEEPPNGGVPPVYGPLAILLNQALAMQAPQVQLRRGQTLPTNMMACEGPPPVMRLPFFSLVPDFFGANQTTPTSSNHTHTETHYHQHVHYHNGANASNANPPVQEPQPTPDTHTWIKLISHGIRPNDEFPLPYRRAVQENSRTAPKALTMKEFLKGLGCPEQVGYGVQQVFPMDGGLWGSGQVFEWGAGQAELKLGSTELGRGIEGREVWIAKWARM